ncbi:MAG: Yip1 family protein [Acidobacteriota bacterium]|jgi:hypothetical protein|nr:Yip1 family protein [Acidobacteriota bacterium]
MNFNAILQRCLALVTKPKEEWETIKAEDTSISDLFMKYALILAAIPALAGLIGYSVIGINFGLGTFRIPFGRGLLWAIVQYVLALVGVYLMGLIVDLLAPSFGAAKDLKESMKIAVYAWTPVWVAGILLIIPALSVITLIVSLYALFLFYLGIKIVKNPPADKAVAYFVVTIIVAVVVSFLISYLARAIAFPGIGSYLGRI